MGDSPTNFKRLTIQQLKGLNEREQHANEDLGAFDILKGALPINKHTITKATGCKLLLSFDEPILNICQTNDSRRNVIVQTANAVRVVTENELFGIPEDEFNLIVTVPPGEEQEENMSQAIITHSEAIGVSAPVITASNTWQQAPLKSIVSQLNPDGTPATFATLASNQVTLAAGTYRFAGWSIMSTNAAGKIAARLYNVTASTPLFNGLSNETSETVVGIDNTQNHALHLAGDVVLAVPTIIEIQGKATGNGSPHTFGLAKHNASFTLPRELYRSLRILKTS